MPKLHRVIRPVSGILLITNHALADLYRAAWQKYPKESGGVLVGHLTSSNPFQSIVRYVVGPGPDARHDLRRFEPDDAWQASEVEKLWNDDRSLEYLGDWHTHPSGSPRPSELDKESLRVIAGSPGAQQSAPVMMIIALSSSATRIGATILMDSTVRGLRVIVSGAEGF